MPLSGDGQTVAQQPGQVRRVGQKLAARQNAQRDARLTQQGAEQTEALPIERAEKARARALKIAVRRGDDGPDAALQQMARHLAGDVRIKGAVIQMRDDVTVQIDHAGPFRVSEMLHAAYRAHADT